MARALVSDELWAQSEQLLPEHDASELRFRPLGATALFRRSAWVRLGDGRTPDGRVADPPRPGTGDFPGITSPIFPAMIADLPSDSPDIGGLLATSRPTLNTGRRCPLVHPGFG